MQFAEEEDNNDNNNQLYYTKFIYSIKTEVTRELYLKVIKYYMKFLGAKNYKDTDFKYRIPEGARNITMFSFANSLLFKYKFDSNINEKN
jgi:hypothetical protein